METGQNSVILEMENILGGFKGFAPGSGADPGPVPVPDPNGTI